MIYMDYHATTPCDPRVVDAMLPHLGPLRANSASSVHEPGRRAADAVEQARALVARLIGAEPNEIVFTSGATESNNLALVGLARGSQNGRRRIVTSSVEHASVRSPCKDLVADGYEVVVLPVEPDGTVSLAAAHEAINDGTLLVTIQAANNEVGTIQMLSNIATLARCHGAAVHCDAAQAVGKIPFDVNDWQVDLVSLSAHKLYGPQGVGALYIRGGHDRLRLRPLQSGGGQEWGLRPGTLNVAGIVGMGVACDLCRDLADEEATRVASMRDRLEGELLARIPGVRRNGALGRRLPGNCSLTLPGVDADMLLARLPALAISTGSACSSGATEPSPVLLALGLTREDAYSTFRVGIGRFTTESEIDSAALQIQGAWQLLA